MNLLIYTNILTPYRKYFFDLLYDQCKKNGDQFNVLLMAETEANRPWKYDALKTEYTILLKSKTLSLGETYFHFNGDLVDQLEKIKPDVVVCAGGYNCPGVWKVAALKEKLNFQCLFWSESHLKEVKANKKAKIIVRDFLRGVIYKRFDGFWYAGELSKEFCVKYADSSAKYYFVPNLVEEKKYTKKSDEQRLEFRQKFDLPEEKCVFVCPARLSPVKGIVEFLEIINNSKIKEKYTIMIAGTGELHDQISQIIQHYALDVRLLGQKTQLEMTELYAAADAFLMPSLSDPNPLTCIEALWSGLPLFISEHCGNYPEVVHQGENGYVFSYKNEEKLLQMFDTLVTSSKEWRKSAENISLSIAKSLYQSQSSAERIIAEMKKSTTSREG